VPESYEDFTKILKDAVDHGLLVLGPSARKAIYFHLEKNYSITQDQIPENMKAFTESLARMFGAGAQVIERLILEDLQTQLGLKIEKSGDSNFLNCLDKAKEMYLDKTETQTEPMGRPQLQSALKYRR
jgi:hypothetical protein